MKKIEKNFFWKKPEFWNPYGQRVSHIKFQQNQRQKNFFVSKGGPFGVFVIFKVSLRTCWSTLTDRNEGSDFLDFWKSCIIGCLNIKKNIWEQVLGAGMTFYWVKWLKTRAGQKDPPPGDNVIPEPRWNRVNRLPQCAVVEMIFFCILLPIIFYNILNVPWNSSYFEMP